MCGWTGRSVRLDLTADGYKKGSEAAQLYRDGVIGVNGSVNDYNAYISGAVDATTPGTYTVYYTASNAFATTTVTRTVHVVDTAPVLTLNGASSVTLEAGEWWRFLTAHVLVEEVHVDAKWLQP